MIVNEFTLVGMIHDPGLSRQRGVVMIAGSPAYRVGPHRQFLLLARDWSACGIPVMRFDYRGQGDSEGERGAECPLLDIRAAINTFMEVVPSVERVVLWGLCDAAQNALRYAQDDPRVDALVLVNPEFLEDDGIRGGSYIEHHYLPRLRRPQVLIARLLGGNIDVKAAIANLVKYTCNYVMSLVKKRPVLLIDALLGFRGRSLVILSEHDIVALEFKKFVMSTIAWNNLEVLGRVTVRDLAAADHNITRVEWRNHVLSWTLDFFQSLD